MMPTTTKLSTSISPKGVKFLELCAAMYNKAQLNDDPNGQAQHLNENSEFPKKLSLLIQECSATNLYASQVVKNEMTYPSEFRRKSENQQIVDLAKSFGLDQKSALKFLETIVGKPSNLPDGCHPQDGRYAIVSPFGFQSLIKGYKDPFSDELYCKSLLMIFDKLSKQRNFYNYSTIDKEQLNQTESLLALYENIASGPQGKNHIWVIDAQLGFYHKGESVNRARELYLSNENGLGSVDIGAIIYNHPDRCVRFSELDIYCPGDKFAPGGGGVFSECPFFYFSAELKFVTSFVSNAYDCFGSASAFLPQS